MENVVIANFPVGPKYNGGAMTVWGILNALIQKKEEVFLILICNQNIKNSLLFHDCILGIKNKNINFKIIFFNEKKYFLNKLNNLIVSFLFSKPNYFFFNQYSLRFKIKKTLSNMNVKRIFCYHFDTLSACYELKEYKIYACLGDLMHEPRMHRRVILNGKNVKNYLQNKLELLLSIKISQKMLKNIFFIGFYAHHYHLFMNKYLNYSNYIRTSIVGPKNIDIKKNFNLTKLLLIGDLTGTVSQSTTIFLEKFLNKYSKKIPKNVNFIFFGYGKLPKCLKKFNNIMHFGVSNDITNEFDNHSCLLACNTIELGIRVRIITALSHGSLVLTHISNTQGIPELKDQHNCIIFNDIKELLDKIIKLHKGFYDIKKIRINAQKTFLQYFNYLNAFEDLLKKSS